MDIDFFIVWNDFFILFISLCSSNGERIYTLKVHDFNFNYAIRNNDIVSLAQK